MDRTCPSDPFYTWEELGASQNCAWRGNTKTTDFQSTVAEAQGILPHSGSQKYDKHIARIAYLDWLGQHVIFPTNNCQRLAKQGDLEAGVQLPWGIPAGGSASQSKWPRYHFLSFLCSICCKQRKIKKKKSVKIKQQSYASLHLRAVLCDVE